MAAGETGGEDEAAEDAVVHRSTFTPLRRTRHSQKVIVPRTSNIGTDINGVGTGISCRARILTACTENESVAMKRAMLMRQRCLANRGLPVRAPLRITR